jgi:hypothetical protein
MIMTSVDPSIEARAVDPEAAEHAAWQQATPYV